MAIFAIVSCLILLIMLTIVAGLFFSVRYVNSLEKRKNDDKPKNDDDAAFTIGDDGELVELDDDDEHDETGTSHGQRLS